MTAINELGVANGVLTAGDGGLEINCGAGDAAATPEIDAASGDAIAALARIAHALLGQLERSPGGEPPARRHADVEGLAQLIDSAQGREDLMERLLDRAMELFRPQAAAIVRSDPFLILHSRNRGLIDGQPASRLSMSVLTSTVLEELERQPASDGPVTTGDPANGGMQALGARISAQERETLVLVLFDQSMPDEAAVRLERCAGYLRQSRPFQMHAATTEVDPALVTALNDATLAAASTPDLETLYVSVREALSKVVPTDAMLIAMIPPGAEDGVCVYRSERSTSYFEHAPLSHPFQTAMKLGRPFIVDEVPEHLYAPDYRFGDPATRVRSLAGAPLVAHDTVTGLIVVQSYEPRAFRIEHADLLLSIGRSIAVAIERAELIERQRAQSVREAALRAVTQRLSAKMDIDDQFAIVLSEMQPVLGETLLAVICRDDASTPARIHVATCGPAALLEAAGITQDATLIEDGVAERALSASGPETSIVDGVALLTSPMLDESACVGSVVLARRSRIPLSADEQASIAILAGTVASALRRARLYRERERDELDLLEVERISRLVASSLDTDTILKDIMAAIPQLFRSEGCSVRIVDGEHLVPLAVHGEIVHSFADRIPIATSLAGTIVREKRLIAVDDLHTHPITGEHARTTGVKVRGWLAAPMIDATGEVFGILSIHSDYPRRWTDRDRALLQTLAGSTTIAIQNAWRFSRTRDVLLASVESLANAVDAKDPTTLNHSRNVSTYARRVAEAMGCSTQFVENVALAGLLHDVGKIGIPDRILQKPDGLDDHEWERMKTHPVIGEQILSGNEHLSPVLPFVRHHHERWDGTGYPDRLAGDRIPLGASIVALADAVDTMASNRPYRKALPWATVRNIVEREAGKQFHPEVARHFLELTASGELGPLHPADDDTQRSITVEARTPGHSLDVQALMIFHGVAREIRALTDLDTFIANITDVIRGVLELSDIQIFLVDEASGDIVFRATEHDRRKGYSDVTRKPGEGVVGWVIQHGVPLNVPDVSLDDRFIGNSRATIRSELAVPLIADGAPIGAINIESSRTAAFSESDERLLTITAAHIAQTVHLARLHDRFKHLASTDGLTGLPNHRAFYERLDEEIRNASTTGGLLTVAIMDIDDLKTINDGYGHLAGDAVLRMIAEVLQTQSRSTDHVARYGGDEFAFILLGVDLDGARRAVGRVIESLKRRTVSLDGDLLPIPTGAWGLATYPEDGPRSAELVRVADQRMYAQKRLEKSARGIATSPGPATGTHG